MPETTFLRIPLSEWMRKAVHMGMFGFAFLLPYITPAQAILCAIGAFCFNAFLLPKLAPAIFRLDENGKPQGALEVVLYPAAILATIVAFSGYGTDGWVPYYTLVIAAWFALAIGDGVMGISYRLFTTGLNLPWNPRKSVFGFIAGYFTLALIPVLQLTFTINERHGVASKGWNYYLSSIIVFSLLVVIVESIWFGIADNLTLPFSIVTAWGLLDIVSELHKATAYHFFIPILFALAALAVKKITIGGAILGLIIATVLMMKEPWLFAFLFGFFVLGVAATKFGFKKKAARGIAEGRGGARGAAEIFGAAGVAAWMTHIHFGRSTAGFFPTLLVIIAPLIAKTMDTVSSEMGKAIGGTTLSLRNFKVVQPGTDGAVSLAGTLWGIAAAALLAALILPLHWGGVTEVVILVAIAFAANLFESYWAVYAAPRGMDDGPHTNFLMTLFAAVLAWFVWCWR